MDTQSNEQQNVEYPGWLEIAEFLREKGFAFTSDSDVYDYSKCVEVIFRNHNGCNDEESRNAAAIEAVEAIQGNWAAANARHPLIITRDEAQVWINADPPLADYSERKLLTLLEKATHLFPWGCREDAEVKAWLEAVAALGITKHD